MKNQIMTDCPKVYFYSRNLFLYYRVVFSSITFIFLFLPLALSGYFLTPAKHRNLTILLFSIFFYAWGEPSLIWVLAMSPVV
jgi:alginate O-acetyltransferase complex protein AlgI